MKVNVTQGQSRFSELVEKAHQGEIIIITKNGVPWADLYPHTRSRRIIKRMDPPPFTLAENCGVCDPHDEDDLAPWR